MDYKFLAPGKSTAPAQKHCRNVLASIKIRITIILSEIFFFIQYKKKNYFVSKILYDITVNINLYSVQN